MVGFFPVNLQGVCALVVREFWLRMRDFRHGMRDLAPGPRDFRPRMRNLTDSYATARNSRTPGQ